MNGGGGGGDGGNGGGSNGDVYHRLYDVLLSGPLYIYLSTFVDVKEAPFIKMGVLAIGVFTILYNFHNMLYFGGHIERPCPFFAPFMTHNGKTQIHRLYNLLLMYPFLYYINVRLTPGKPKWLESAIYILIALGFAYNLYYFVKYTGIYPVKK